MAEESRLGREQLGTSWALKQIITAGIRAFYYMEDKERTLGSPTDKLLMSVTAFADEMEREKARQRTSRLLGFPSARRDGLPEPSEVPMSLADAALLEAR